MDIEGVKKYMASTDQLVEQQRDIIDKQKELLDVRQDRISMMSDTIEILKQTILILEDTVKELNFENEELWNRFSPNIPRQPPSHTLN